MAPAARLTGMASALRLRIAVVTATLILLVAGLSALAVTAEHSVPHPNPVLTARVHHGLPAPIHLRIQAASALDVHQLDEGLLAAVLLIAVSSMLVARSRSAAAPYHQVAVGLTPSRGPPILS